MCTSLIQENLKINLNGGNKMFELILNSFTQPYLLQGKTSEVTLISIQEISNITVYRGVVNLELGF